MRMGTGLNSQLLDKIAEKMQHNYDTGKAAGSTILVVRHGQIGYQHSVGYMNSEEKRPTQRDTIFRIYSMSKPITMTALMQLYEKGLVYMEDPLYEYIPEFKDMKVAVTKPDGTIVYEKQKTPITIKQLCTMTSGISYPGDGDAGEQAMKKLQATQMSDDLSTIQIAKLVAEQGLLSFQPGSQWKYGFSHDIVGVVVEVISGKTYGEYLRENIFKPLQMKDTAFFVPQDKRARLSDACSYQDGKYISLQDKMFTTDYYHAPAFESGGGGMVSTVDDYTHFCQMLLNQGEFNNERILGRKTIEMMRTNQLTDAQKVTFDWQSRGYDYGIGMRTHAKPWIINGSVGEFGWDGMMGTWMAVDPEEDLTVVYMQNMIPHNTNGMRLMPIIYGAME